MLMERYRADVAGPCCKDQGQNVRQAGEEVGEYQKEEDQAGEEVGEYQRK